VSALSETVLWIATRYLGPAAKVFLQRQCTAHLGGAKFDDLRPEQLPEMAKWVELSAGLIIEKDRAKVLGEAIRSSA